MRGATSEAGARRWSRRAVVLLAGAVVVLELVPLPTAHARGSQCFRPGVYEDSVRYADELLANRYTFPPHPTVTLPSDPTWSEDPLGDANWVFQFHSMRYVWHLLQAWEKTLDPRYLLRYRFLLQDWWRDNPISAPPSPYSWNDHATAWRAMMYACGAEHLLREPWFVDALEAHGALLADPAFYYGQGNHALNQDIGLLAVGCVLERDEWISTATQRLGRLAAGSIDPQGVTNEQAVEYQTYNYWRYSEVKARLQACDQPVPPEIEERLALMPDFLAHATLPNREYEMIGDTGRLLAEVIPGTTAQFAATAGAAGPRPAAFSVLYDAGYAFGRSGWGRSRPYADEAFYSLRFGPGRRLHGHSDGTAVTLYGYGSRLLLDSGKYKYVRDPWRGYFVGPSAHNVVTVDGTAFSTAAPTPLAGYQSAPGFDFAEVRSRAWSGVSSRRRVVFSRAGRYLIVADDLRADGARTFRQLWHLPVDARPTVDGRLVATRRDRGNVLIRQLAGAPWIVVKQGRLRPIQGWRSFLYGERVAAPTVEAVARGSAVRYLTLIVPTAARNIAPTAYGVRLHPDGFSLLVTVGSRTERVVVNGSRASVARVP